MLGMPDLLTEIEVISSPYAMAHAWEFPYHRFFEWETKDEPFCRKYGIGREVYRPAIIQTNIRGRPVILVHPSLMPSFLEQSRRA